MINGKEYPMWEGLVAVKDRFIGGRLVERDRMCGTVETIITDVRMEANGEDSASICVDGKEWSFRGDVGCHGIGALPDKDGFRIVATYGGGDEWEMHTPPQITEKAANAAKEKP